MCDWKIQTITKGMQIAHLNDKVCRLPGLCESIKGEIEKLFWKEPVCSSECSTNEIPILIPHQLVNLDADQLIGDDHIQEPGWLKV